MSDRDYAEHAARLEANSNANHDWRRGECINLIPSEQTTSALVDRLGTSDPASRYNEHKRGTWTQSR